MGGSIHFTLLLLVGCNPIGATCHLLLKRPANFHWLQRLQTHTMALPSFRSRFLVFVYGSLKTNFRNHYKMTGAQLVAKAETKDPYPLVIYGERGTPYLLPNRGLGKNIRGEVYVVEEDKLQELDILERCYARYYKRNVIPLKLENGTTINCFTYLRNEDHVTDDMLHQPHLEEFTPEHNSMYTPSTRPPLQM